MSDTATHRRIRAQASTGDEAVMGFVLDENVQAGSSTRLEPGDDAPLAHALFALPGIARVEVSGKTIWVKAQHGADWAALKPAIAAAIRNVLDETDAPLGRDDAPQAKAPDAELRAAVQDLLDRQVNPAVAAHGGQISVDRVADRNVYLQMSGGCQGCAASAATLRQGVERMLRAALPQIGEIIDVTDHAAGNAPFYARDNGPSPILNRPVPEGVIALEQGKITVDPDYLAPRLGLTPQTLRAGLNNGNVVGVTEIGEGSDLGKSRITVRSTDRAWAAEVDATGAAHEIPPPRPMPTSRDNTQKLSDRVRAYLQSLDADKVPISYGALARALGLWMPGSVGKVTKALETTMREDAATGRPFIAARAVSRGSGNLPGKGFFELARTLSGEPPEGESESEFHARELRRLNEAGTKKPAPIALADNART